MWLATQAGSIAAAALAAGLFIALNDRALAAEIVLGTLTLWLVVETLKVLTDRARPFLVLTGTRIVGWRERGRSFPSGHTAQAFFLATLLSQRLEPGSRGPWRCSPSPGWSVLHAYVGAHYPRDVIGALLGSVGRRPGDARAAPLARAALLTATGRRRAAQGARRSSARAAAGACRPARFL
jgi:membrane-associated phospholipid phosphatase